VHYRNSDQEQEQRQLAQQSKLAEIVEQVVTAPDMPSHEILQDFEAISKLPTDEDLLAALQ
jgi:hypothetical protein